MSRILVIAHNHPDLHPGGTEIVARDLARAYREAGHETLFVGATNGLHRDPHPGTHFGTVGTAPDEILFWSGHFDRFSLSQTDLYGAMGDLATLLEEFRPDIIHLHHLLLIGAEFVPMARRLLPKACIVLTLHDYYLICAHDGLMVKTTGRRRCEGATPDACHACFDAIPPERFLLRERFLKTNLAAIDRFVAPSAFLRDRFSGWDLEEDRITVIANGRPSARPAPVRSAPDARRTVFGYFGNLNAWKGVTVLLDAIAILGRTHPDVELRVHGGAPFQSEAVLASIDAAFDRAGRFAVRCGPYGLGEIPDLMSRVDWAVVPSIWWENAPLVIGEARLHGRPVIASAIGGMAEAVRHDVDGLLARPDDPVDLARTMARAIEEPGLWERLAAAAAPPPSVAAMASAHLALFDEIRARPAARVN